MKWVLADFLSGALTASFLVAGILFLRFWRRTIACFSRSPWRSGCSR
jgi:hypothetical protein